MWQAIDPRLLLVASCLLGAVGQLLLKLGATGVPGISGLVNLRVASGLLCYGIGTLLWLLALARLPLSRVYPFTILTFVIVYVASVLILGERLTASLLIGVLLVCAGLVVIVRY